MTDVLGIHHVTAIASDPQRNVNFYAGVLGLRLVKRTVNFDDPHTYHLYYGDEAGTPGSLMTFFPWPGAERGRQGAGEVAVSSFAVLPNALGFWIQRFLRHGVAYEGPTKRRPGESVLQFRDHDGLLLEIVTHAGAEAAPAWGGAPGIAREHAIHGFHAVTLWVEAADATERLLVETFGFRAVSEDSGVHRYATGGGSFVDVREIGGFMRGSTGPGTVHHVAWSVSDAESQLSVRERVLARGLSPTGVVDRYYFRSVYFREPGGVLFEVATQGPGFTIDEPLEHLGERLTLPPQYEPQRADIVSQLPPIESAGAITSA